MKTLNRRAFLASDASVPAVQVLPKLASRPPVRRVLTLVYDKSIGAMRAIDRVVR